MKKNLFPVLIAAMILSSSPAVLSQDANGKNVFETDKNTVVTPFQFNGYTNHWQDVYRLRYRYGGLFKMAVEDVRKNILQSKVDVAEDMGVPGFTMEEGFLNALFAEPYGILANPGKEALNTALQKGNVLAFVDASSDAGKALARELPQTDAFVKELKSHQYDAADLKKVKACVLQKGGNKLFVVWSDDAAGLSKIKDLIARTKSVIDGYDMHKGWFGAYTLVNSVTCTPGHFLDVIGTGMNEGNDWFVFSGYMDFLSKNDLEKWMKDVSLPVVTDVGFSPIYGCKDYEGLQVQDMVTKESWINYAREKEGYVFRHVWDTTADPYHYNGYFAIEGNKEQIDEEAVPFVLNTGRLLENDALNSMVLFTPKGTEFDRKAMWDAIMDRREVGIFAKGKMTGPAEFRHALGMLLLDREYLENYFSERINIATDFSGYTLNIDISNTLDKPVDGQLRIVLPDGIKAPGRLSQKVTLPARSSKAISIALEPSGGAMGRMHPVAVHFVWDGHEKSTISNLDLPPAISVHRLLFGHAPKVEFPVTVHNFMKKSSFPVVVKVEDAHTGKAVFKGKKTFAAQQADFATEVFVLDLKPGDYTVNISALGVETTAQLGVGAAKGKPYLYSVDLNSDGVPEYRMENDSVRITLLATGARVIEYIVKSRDDNVLFKLWPKKAIDDKRPFRKRAYYPYGGFEDFLGQASMETHKVYDVEVIKDKGDFVRVKMSADYFGNKLEKTFTLYGNSPLLEVRFALTFKNPEANVLGPQPILELGKRHWTEDVFIVPDKKGLEEWRMKPERYYGHLFFQKEGWNAGYDTKEDITYVGAYPVDQPLFLHMWMNHPRNGDAHHYYAEFQPWLPIFRRTTTYFTYYLWGAGGPWVNSVKALRSLNLITER